MPGICLYFRIHQPVAIRKVSFFDFGSTPDLIDRKKNSNKLKNRLDQVYLPAFSMLRNLISKHKGAVQLALSVNGMLLDQISHFSPSYYKEIRDFMNQEEIEIIASSYFHSLASLASQDEFRIQVNLEKKKILEVTGNEPVFFCNPDLSFRTSMLTILRDLQMNGIFIRSQSDSQLKSGQGPFIYNHPKVKNVWFFPVYEAFSEKFIRGALLPRRESNRLITEMVDKIGAGGSSPVVLLIDPDSPAGTEIDIIKSMDFLKHFVDRCLITEGADFWLPSQYLKNPHKNQKRFAVERMIPDSGHKHKRNILVKEAMRYLYSLEKRIKSRKDQDLLFQWRILQSYDHLQKLEQTDSLQGIRSPGSEESLTPHEAYLDFMNALTALDIYIKN